MNYEPIRRAILGLMDEVTPTLAPLPGVNIKEYKQTLIERFSNPKVRDRLSRLCLNSSDKLPKFIFGSLRDKLEQDGSIDYLSFTIALWLRYLQGTDEQGQPLEISKIPGQIFSPNALAWLAQIPNPCSRLRKSLAI